MSINSLNTTSIIPTFPAITPPTRRMNHLITHNPPILLILGLLMWWSIYLPIVLLMVVAIATLVDFIVPTVCWHAASNWTVRWCITIVGYCLRVCGGQTFLCVVILPVFMEVTCRICSEWIYWQFPYVSLRIHCIQLSLIIINCPLCTISLHSIQLPLS